MSIKISDDLSQPYIGELQPMIPRMPLVIDDPTVVGPGKYGII